MERRQIEIVQRDGQKECKLLSALVMIGLQLDWVGFYQTSIGIVIFVLDNTFEDVCITICGVTLTDLMYN